MYIPTAHARRILVQGWKARVRSLELGFFSLLVCFIFFVPPLLYVPPLIETFPGQEVLHLSLTSAGMEPVDDVEFATNCAHLMADSLHQAGWAASTKRPVPDCWELTPYRQSWIQSMSRAI